MTKLRASTTSETIQYRWVGTWFMPFLTSNWPIFLKSRPMWTLIINFIQITEYDLLGLRIFGDQRIQYWWQENRISAKWCISRDPWLFLGFVQAALPVIAVSVGKWKTINHIYNRDFVDVCCNSSKWNISVRKLAKSRTVSYLFPFFFFSVKVSVCFPPHFQCHQSKQKVTWRLHWIYLVSAISQRARGRHKKGFCTVFPKCFYRCAYIIIFKCRQTNWPESAPGSHCREASTVHSATSWC